MTRDLSELGAYVDCHTPVTIPLYRLVQFQLESEARDVASVPRSLRTGRVLSAVYRLAPSGARGSTAGLALRLLVDPARVAPCDERRATA